MTHDDPIDHILYKVADSISPAFKTLRHTPNMITTYSLVFGLLCAYCLYKDNIVGFVIFYVISYFFDCMDGHFARKYKMTSKFGDWYDHVKDIVVWFIILYIAYLKYSSILKPVHIAVLLFIVSLLFIHIGCQRKQLDENKKQTLDVLRDVCPDKSIDKYTKYIGTGMFNLFFVLYIVYLYHLRTTNTNKF